MQRGQVARESLAPQNMRMPGCADRLALLGEQIPQLGSSIVYALTTRNADRVTEWPSGRRPHLNGIGPLR